jgi:Methyltransferase domain
MTDTTPEWYASDNSFVSRELMDVFHRPIIELAQQLLGESGGAVLDLGCGNGALLRTIHQAVPHSVAYGVECNADRVAHAHTLMPEFANHIHCGNLLGEIESLWAPNRQFKVAILMPGHLLSVPVARVERLKRRLVKQCQHVILYCYQDWLLRHGSLKQLAAETALLVTPVFTSSLVATGLLHSTNMD